MRHVFECEQLVHRLTGLVGWIMIYLKVQCLFVIECDIIDLYIAMCNPIVYVVLLTVFFAAFGF